MRCNACGTFRPSDRRKQLYEDVFYTQVNSDAPVGGYQQPPAVKLSNATGQKETRAVWIRSFDAAILLLGKLVSVWPVMRLSALSI